MFDEPEDWNSHANYLQCDWEQFVMTYLAPDAIHFLVREDFQGKKTSTEVFGIIASTSTTGVFIHPDEESTYQQDLLLAKKFCSRYD
jgi:hypothetical protein